MQGLLGHPALAPAPPRARPGITLGGEALGLLQGTEALRRAVVLGERAHGLGDSRLQRLASYQGRDDHRERAGRVIPRRVTVRERRDVAPERERPAGVGTDRRGPPASRPRTPSSR